MFDTEKDLSFFNYLDFVYLCLGEDEVLQISIKVDDGEFDRFSARVEGDDELRPTLQVGQVQDVPRTLGQLAAPKSADERKLGREPKWEHIPGIIRKRF